MEQANHTLSDLFGQLGLPATEREIDRFIAIHSPLSARIALADAPFWQPAQAKFLREELADDADWAELVDMLDARLRTYVPYTFN